MSDSGSSKSTSIILIVIVAVFIIGYVVAEDSINTTGNITSNTTNSTVEVLNPENVIDTITNSTNNTINVSTPDDLFNVTNSSDNTQSTLPNPVIDAVLVDNSSNDTSQNVVKPDPVQKIQECKDKIVQDVVPVYGNCTRPVVCQNITNETCDPSITEEIYQCYTGIQNIDRTVTECKTVGLKINNKIQLDIRDYACSTQNDTGTVTVVCDSKYDGNGDGICTSGESCMKFIVNGSNVEKYKKNSRNGFVSGDSSYFLNEVSVEVLS
jgi:hypothetical protein